MTRPTVPLFALLLAALAAPASAQVAHDFSVGVMGGLGGAFDADPDTGYDDFGWQALFALRREPHTFFVVRAGQLELQVDEADGGPAFDSTLAYLTLAGEYRFFDGFYESGLYLGIGGYDLDGDFFVADETSFGLVAGITGDFRLTDRLSFVVELSGHWADLDHAQTFLAGHAGIAFHF